MTLQIVASLLTLYFALFLGISGLAKLDRPLGEQSGAESRLRYIRLFLSPAVSRLLGIFEIVLAFLIALGIRIELVTIATTLLFGLFLLFKMFLILTKQGSNCGCFGAHKLIAIDRASIGTSVSILGLAVLLTILAQWAANPLRWITAIVFLSVFGWIVFKTLQRHRLEDRLIQEVSTVTPR